MILAAVGATAYIVASVIAGIAALFALAAAVLAAHNSRRVAKANENQADALARIEVSTNGNMNALLNQVNLIGRRLDRIEGRLGGLDDEGVDQGDQDASVVLDAGVAGDATKASARIASAGYVSRNAEEEQK